MDIQTYILTVYDADGNPIEIPAIQGKTAYAYAKDGGYTGTEAEFADKMAVIVMLYSSRTRMAYGRKHLQMLKDISELAVNLVQIPL